MKTSWRSASLVASAATVLALTTACGQDSGTQSASQNVGATAPAGGYGSTGLGTDAGTGTDAGAAPGEQNAVAAAAAAGELSVTADAELGQVLTDSAGRTLYRFDQDTAEPPKTNCEGDCATAWPPVPADDATAGEGVDAAVLGEVTRPDGSEQLTVDGWPVYRYAKDVAPGDTKGQGVGGTWYALAPRRHQGRGGGTARTVHPQRPGARRDRHRRRRAHGLPLHQGLAVADEDRVHR
ncbi:hypothetical protein GCM10020295_72400 [Streptomyces cinereospinus]